ncbi:hypothetical protein [Epilithonimonas tenax]|uniref:hypothetical protein n=1 Tax=Epilithonimonas tenax TaxID=191577 RepID=UPI0012B59EFF|nr:hypothetical protein [Epilithonimonas tenax]
MSGELFRHFFMLFFQRFEGEVFFHFDIGFLHEEIAAILHSAQLNARSNKEFY